MSLLPSRYYCMGCGSALLSNSNIVECPDCGLFMEVPSSTNSSQIDQPNTPTSTISSISDIMQQSMKPNQIKNETFNNQNFNQSSPSLHSTVDIRTNIEESNFNPSDDETPNSNRRRRRNKKRDPKAPKRAANAYMLFCKQQRPLLRQRQPDLPFAVIGQTLGDMWRTLPAEERKPYEDCASSDRDRYKIEMHQYTTSALRTPNSNSSNNHSINDNNKFHVDEQNYLSHNNFKDFQYQQSSYRGDNHPQYNINNNQFPSSSSMMNTSITTQSTSTRFHPYSRNANDWSSSARSSLSSVNHSQTFSNTDNNNYGPLMKRQRRMSGATQLPQLFDDSTSLNSFNPTVQNYLPNSNYSASSIEFPSLISSQPYNSNVSGGGVRRGFDNNYNPSPVIDFAGAADNYSYEIPFRGFSNDYNLEASLNAWTNFEHININNNNNNTNEEQ